MKHPAQTRSRLIPSNSTSITSHDTRRYANFVDNRPETVTQRQLADVIAQSPQMAAQGALSDSIHQSPYMVAQRKHFANLFGDSIQLRTVEEDEPLQGKFATETSTTQRVESAAPYGESVQLRTMEEDELLQGKFATETSTTQCVESAAPHSESIQLQTMDEDELLQGKFATETSMAQRVESVAPQANHTGLPNHLKEGIENLSGLAMDDVRVHYNSSKPSQLQALAYTQGSDIHVAPGQEQYLPHEAWHVVQQKQGRVKPTIQMKGVALNDDRTLEREADLMGARASRTPYGTYKTQLKHSSSVSLGRGAAMQHMSVVQRVELGQKPMKKGDARLTSNTLWAEEAAAYEKRLGIYAYRHKRAKTALDQGLTKMQKVITTYYLKGSRETIGRAERKNQRRLKKEALYRDVFTKDDLVSAGQIGTYNTLSRIEGMLKRGNLRERMTAFYNAAYYNSSGSPGNTPMSGFKEIVAKILFQEKERALADTLDLNQEDLLAKSKFLKKSPLLWGVRSLAELTKFGYNFHKDPFALGNLTLAEGIGGTCEISQSQYERINRPEEEKEREKRSASYYQGEGIGLSIRERAYTAWKLNMTPEDWFYDSALLPWQEGHTYYKMPPPVGLSGISWSKKIRDTLHMPIVAGISGTTTRMLTAFKWLNAGDPLYFRLALMGWMLPAWDHSLYEIMRGSHLAGVKSVRDPNLGNVIDMYMNVPPLTTNELRANVASNRMFPHEEIYLEQMKQKTGDDGFMAIFDTHKVEITEKYDSRPRRHRRNIAFNKAHASAIYLYTSGMHSLMNTLLHFNAEASGAHEVTSKKKLQSILKESAHDFCRGRYLKTKPVLTPKEEAEWQKLEAKKPEIIHVFEKGGMLAEWENECSNFARRTTTSEKVNNYINTIVNPYINSIIDPLYEELKSHINMAVEGLNALPAPPDKQTHVVYRGDWSAKIGSQYEKGKTIIHNAFTSYSYDRDTAKGFATSGNCSHRVLVRLTLKKKSNGRDISHYSMFQEEEILMPPGSKIRITDVKLIKVENRVQYKLCNAEEI